tara:strand:- start:616 stop:1227 length:612 start_codon:yes stop_codon:yes gene_type:complete
MPFIGVQPATVPLTSSDITDGIISTAKIADDAVGNTKLDLGASYAFTGSVTGAGTILQIVQSGTIAQSINTSAGSWADSNYTLAITPSATSSKVLVMMHFPFLLKGSGTKVRGGLRLNRTISSTTTLIWNTDSYNEMYHTRDAGGTPDETNNLMHMSFLDSPSTTSATTYTMQHQIRNDTGATQSICYQSAYGGQMLLLEIRG